MTPPMRAALRRIARDFPLKRAQQGIPPVWADRRGEYEPQLRRDAADSLAGREDARREAEWAPERDAR